MGHEPVRLPPPPRPLLRRRHALLCQHPDRRSRSVLPSPLNKTKYSSIHLTRTNLPVRSDLFQHRLWLPSPPPSSPSEVAHPHRWTSILIPLADFTLTNSGDLSEVQIEMLRSRIRTVGISVLGPMEGRYELGIEAIDAVSEEEVRRVQDAEDKEMREKEG